MRPSASQTPLSSGYGCVACGDGTGWERQGERERERERMGGRERERDRGKTGRNSRGSGREQRE
jgi:hypothetical protein